MSCSLRACRHSRIRVSGLCRLMWAVRWAELTHTAVEPRQNTPAHVKGRDVPPRDIARIHPRSAEQFDGAPADSCSAPRGLIPIIPTASFGHHRQWCAGRRADLRPSPARRSDAPNGAAPHSTRGGRHRPRLVPSPPAGTGRPPCRSALDSGGAPRIGRAYGQLWQRLPSEEYAFDLGFLHTHPRATAPCRLKPS
jgi:hypothetical protein